MGVLSSFFIAKESWRSNLSISALSWPRLIVMFRFLRRSGLAALRERRPQQLQLAHQAGADHLHHPGQPRRPGLPGGDQPPPLQVPVPGTEEWPEWSSLIGPDPPKYCALIG